jgi:hypothetical protein
MPATSSATFLLPKAPYAEWPRCGLCDDKPAEVFVIEASVHVRVPRCADCAPRTMAVYPHATSEPITCDAMGGPQ